MSVNMNNLGSVKIDKSKTQIIPKNKKRDQVNIDNNLDDENYNKFIYKNYKDNEKKVDISSHTNIGKNFFENKINDFQNLSNN